MNIVEKIKAFMWFNDALAKAKEVKKGMDKPGYKTTEFWITSAVSVWGMFGGMLPSPWNAIVPIAAQAVYTIARTLAKSNVIKGSVGVELAK